jgi:outer membrane protein
MPNKLCHNNCNKKAEEMDTLVSGVKKFIKAYSEKDTLISMELEMLLFCMLKKNMISKDIVKALNDKYKAAAKTEDKAEDKTELKQKNNFPLL